MHEQMTSKQRVITTLNHQQPDRVPIDIGGTSTTAIHVEIEKMIKNFYHLEDHGVEVRNTDTQGTVPEQSVMDFLGSDVCLLHMLEPIPWNDNGDGTFTNQWNIVLKLNEDGYYYNMVGHPLEKAESIQEIIDWDFPEPNERMIIGLAERAEKNQNRFCVLEGFRESCFGLPSWMRRSDNFYVDLLAEPKMAEALIEKMVVGFIGWLDFVMPRIGKYVDMVKFNDDLGTSLSTIISPDLYRRLVKPYQKKLYSHVKDKYHKPILLHSCGAVHDLIGDFIDIGVDALNPVQISCPNMNPLDLKREFGHAITFWGGGIDTTNTLVRGTMEEIRNQVRENMEALKADGGFVFAAVHNIQPSVTLERFMAMLEAFRENSDY